MVLSRDPTQIFSISKGPLYVIFRIRLEYIYIYKCHKKLYCFLNTKNRFNKYLALVVLSLKIIF